MSLRGLGDAWVWTAICADTKVIPSWHLGNRNAESARVFMEDLASRLANRVQLTTDGLKVYLAVVGQSFGWDVDYAMLVKLYGEAVEGHRRYSPPAVELFHAGDDRRRGVSAASVALGADVARPDYVSEGIA